MERTIKETTRLLAQRIITRDEADKILLGIFSVMLSLPDVEKRERIAYLKGVTEYTIWADYVPDGDNKCDKYQDELEKLLSNEA